VSERVAAIIAAVGASTVRELRATHSFCSEVELADRPSIRRYAREQAERVQAEDFSLLKELLAARRAVHASAAASGVERRLRSVATCSTERSRAVPLVRRG
jgi:hypothetical protein